MTSPEKLAAMEAAHEWANARLALFAETSKNIPWTDAAVARLGNAERALMDALSALPSAPDAGGWRTIAENFEDALLRIVNVGDGYGQRNQQSGTTGEGHADCREIAEEALNIAFGDLPTNSDEANRSSIITRYRARLPLPPRAAET